MEKGLKFLSELKLHTDYFKWREEDNRYENWNEACEDIIRGHAKRYKNYNIVSYLVDAEEAIKDRLGRCSI